MSPLEIVAEVCLEVTERQLLRRIAAAVALIAVALLLIWLLGLALGYLFGPFAGVPIGESLADYS